MATIPGPSSSQPQAPQSNKRIQQTQAQVDEVVDIMRVNVEKVLERDQKLSELDDRAGALQAGAQQFESTATRLKRKYWWKNLKMWLILVAVLLVIIIIIIVWVVSATKSSEDITTTTTNPAPHVTQAAQTASEVSPPHSGQ